MVALRCRVTDVSGGEETLKMTEQKPGMVASTCSPGTWEAAAEDTHKFKANLRAPLARSIPHRINSSFLIQIAMPGFPVSC